MPRPTGRTYSPLRFVAPLLLLIHLGIRLIFPNPSIFADLVLYNAIAFLAAGSVLSAPSFNDYWAKIAISLALILWAIGSTISSWNLFFTFKIPANSTDVCYGFFYPLMCFGLFRALSTPRKIVSLELIDTLIIALGTTSVISGLLLKPAMLHFQGSAYVVFFSIFYPVGDVVLIAITVALALKAGMQVRSILFLAAVSTFAVSDLYFLWISNNNNYQFGALTDDGWLLALCFIAESLWHSGGEVKLNEKVNNYATTISLLLSALILAIAALRPYYFPAFVLIPGFSTLLLAFFRMMVAIKDARQISEERELARTDELTGLANRRKFLSDLELLLRKEGTLLILDLNGFKKINDGFGHDVGDELLRQVAIRFARAISPDVVIARLGGDEFGVIIYGSAKKGREVALALRATLSYPFSLPNGEVTIGVSIGSCQSSPKITSKEELLRSADAAMYQAKRGESGLVERGK